MPPRSARMAAQLASLIGFTGCADCGGARTGLFVPDFRRDDAGFDAPQPMEAGIEAAVDVPVDTRPPHDLCVELPYEEPPERVLVSFEARIQSADVLFLVDTTGSMNEEIEQIRRTIRDVLAPAMRAEIPDVHISVAQFDDFPVGPYGSGPDRPLILLQSSTSDLALVQRAVDRMMRHFGGDEPESQVEALYLTATGEGFGRWVPRALCPAGTVGYPCFRPRGARIILLFTDAPFHNGPDGAFPYGFDVVPRPHTYDDAVVALRAIGARVLGLYSGPSGGEGWTHLQRVARDTGAVEPTGRPIVFDIGADARGLDRGVIESVRTLADEVLIDIDALAEDVPHVDDVDATVFVRRIAPLRAEPPSGARIRGARFEDVRPGTRVTFSVELYNDRYPPATEDRVYYLRIVLRGDGVTLLQETIVAIVVPGMRGGGCEAL
ncbi:MAG: VWA domain-containing protein [Myxococcota bacterium]|nr:VWA domain-containing protein [Myxococcota bacterium]MDW8363427.1 vWA domain-containing protein [Myxococcales bacterium]